MERKHRISRKNFNLSICTCTGKFTGAIFDGAQNSPSEVWRQQRLRCSGRLRWAIQVPETTAASRLNLQRAIPKGNGTIAAIAAGSERNCL
jgi:hypothetical protein